MTMAIYIPVKFCFKYFEWQSCREKKAFRLHTISVKNKRGCTYSECNIKAHGKSVVFLWKFVSVWMTKLKRKKTFGTIIIPHSTSKGNFNWIYGTKNGLYGNFWFDIFICGFCGVSSIFRVEIQNSFKRISCESTYNFASTTTKLVELSCI